VKNSVTKIFRACGFIGLVWICYDLTTSKPNIFAPEVNTDNYHTIIRDTSPNGKALVELVEACNENSCYTQIIISMEGRAEGLYSVQGENLNMWTGWKNDDTLIIKTKTEYNSLLPKTAFKTGF
jgi:hypothetical protein